MAQVDNSWSRWVSWLKVILPLVALAMLSSIFLVSRSIDPTTALPYTDVDVADRAREPRLTAPRFSGVTDDGALVTLDAEDMRPDLQRPGSGSATQLKARMVTPDGGTTDVESATGQIDSTAGTYQMTGDVKVTNSAGYVFTAPFVTGSLNASDLDATGPVDTDAPMGHITSDAMQLRADPDAPGQYLLVFNGRVRLVYTPEK